MGVYGRYIYKNNSGFSVRLPGTKSKYFSRKDFVDAVRHRNAQMIAQNIRHIDYKSVFFGIVPDRETKTGMPLGICKYISTSGKPAFSASANGILKNGHTGRVSKSLTLTDERTEESIISELLEWRIDMEWYYARGRKGYFK